MGFKGQASNKSNEQKYPLPPAGNHPAVCIGIIDLGTQEEEFAGKKKQDVHKIAIFWELTTLLAAGYSDGRNHIMGCEYTFSCHTKSKLRKLVEAWRGQAYPDGAEIDYDVIVGRPCLLGLSLGKADSGNDYAKIDTVGQVPMAGGVPIMQVPRPKHQPFTWAMPEADKPWTPDTGLSLMGPDGKLVPQNNFALPDWDWLPALFGAEVKDLILLSPEGKAKFGAIEQAKAATPQAAQNPPQAAPGSLPPAQSGQWGQNTPANQPPAVAATAASPVPW